MQRRKIYEKLQCKIRKKYSKLVTFEMVLVQNPLKCFVFSVLSSIVFDFVLFSSFLSFFSPLLQTYMRIYIYKNFFFTYISVSVCLSSKSNSFSFPCYICDI